MRGFLSPKGLFLDIYGSLVLFLSDYTQTKLKYQSKAVARKVHLSYCFERKALISIRNGQVICFAFFFRNQWDFRWFFAEAALYGQLIFCRWIINHGVYDYDDALGWAAEGCQMKVCKWSIQHGATSFDRALSFAARGGHLSVCKRMTALGANNFNWPLALAAESGYEDICEWAIRLGANSFNWSLSNAAKSGHLQICRRMIELGASDLDRVIDIVTDEKTVSFLMKAKQGQKLK